MELKIRPTPLTDGLLRGDDAAFNFCAIKMLDHARQMERERAYLLEKDASNRATMDTLKEQLKAYAKAAYDLRCLLHEVADHCGINTSLWPSAIADRLKQMKDDKDEIGNMWEKLTRSIGAHGPGSDPLTGCDTNDEIQTRAMERIRDLIVGHGGAVPYCDKTCDRCGRFVADDEEEADEGCCARELRPENREDLINCAMHEAYGPPPWPPLNWMNAEVWDGDPKAPPSR